MPELAPNTGSTDFLRREYERQSQIPEHHKKIILEEHGNFEYAHGKTMDISRYLLDNSADSALEDASSMYAFFCLSANKAKQREEAVDSKLKLLQASYDKTKRVSDGKAEIIKKEEYQKWQTLLIRYRSIRRNCESMARAMELRLDSARSKNVDRRFEMTGSYLSK